MPATDPAQSDVSAPCPFCDQPADWTHLPAVRQWFVGCEHCGEHYTREQPATLKRLPDAQHRRLMRFHLAGDFGPGQPVTYVALVNGGYVAEIDRRPVMTAKGTDYCRWHAVN